MLPGSEEDLQQQKRWTSYSQWC